MILQGNVYWVELGTPSGSEPGFRRPFVIIQNDLVNASRINTVIACALTGNLRRAGVIGNVRLEAGEAGLPRASVVNVTQVFTLDRSQLSDPIGRVSARRVREILEGLRLVLEPAEGR